MVLSLYRTEVPFFYLFRDVRHEEVYERTQEEGHRIKLVKGCYLELPRLLSKVSQDTHEEFLILWTVTEPLGKRERQLQSSLHQRTLWISKTTKSTVLSVFLRCPFDELDYGNSKEGLYLGLRLLRNYLSETREWS